RETGPSERHEPRCGRDGPDHASDVLAGWGARTPHVSAWWWAADHLGRPSADRCYHGPSSRSAAVAPAVGQRSNAQTMARGCAPTGRRVPMAGAYPDLGGRYWYTNDPG